MVISPLIRVRCIVTPLITPLIRIALRTFLQDQAAEKCARTYPGALEPSAEAQGLWFRALSLSLSMFRVQGFRLFQRFRSSALSPNGSASLLSGPRDYLIL